MSCILFSTVPTIIKQTVVTILCLCVGAGESGKSTLVKQMKIIHSDGFTKEELRSFRPTVMDNLLSSMKYVLSGMGLLRINLQSAKNKVRQHQIFTKQYIALTKKLILCDMFTWVHRV